MEGLFSLLLFAAVFYFMMRFGCGAHMIHGHGGHSGHSAAPLDAGRDPVCGMQVDAGNGYAMGYQGRDHRFCSRKCLDQFEASPQRYASIQVGSK